MTNIPFPWLALGLGSMVAAALLLTGAFSPQGVYQLPLLTMLVLSEFGFFVTAIGAGLGIRALLVKGMQPALFGASLADALLAIMFLYLGVRMWPGNFSF